jgi:hypothetical protein
MLTTSWLMLLLTHGRNHTHHSSSGCHGHCILRGPLAVSKRGSYNVPSHSITWTQTRDGTDGCYYQTDGSRGWGLCSTHRGQGIRTSATRTISRLGETWQDESIGPHHGGWSWWDSWWYGVASSRGGTLDIVLVCDPRMIITTTNPSLDIVPRVLVIYYYCSACGLWGWLIGNLSYNMTMNTHNNTRTQYATRFYNLDARNRITYMTIASCDLYATHTEAVQWGHSMQGLHDGYIIETVTHTDQPPHSWLVCRPQVWWESNNILLLALGPWPPPRPFWFQQARGFTQYT